MSKYAEKYAICSLCEKCGKVPNMRQSHICVFLTCLTAACDIDGCHLCVSDRHFVLKKNSIDIVFCVLI